jgi:Tat protein translocase TatB subunit
MQVGPGEILVILIVALLVFGPQRLPEVGRQVGAAVRELRRMQDTVRGELDMVLHPEHGTPSAPVAAEPDDHTVISGELTAPSDASADPPPAEGADAENRFHGPPDSFI